MASSRLWREILLVLAGFTAIVGLSWLVVLALKPHPSAAGAGFELGLELERTLAPAVQKNLELYLNGRVIATGPLADRLKDLNQRLLAGIQAPLPFTPTVVLLDNPEVNALTLPGGQIVVFRGLADRITAPAELAAVLAHELGHVAHHHIAQALVRDTALAIALSSLGGLNLSDLQNLLHSLTAKAFGREAELEADDFAVDLLSHCQIRPGHLADALAKLDVSPTGQWLEATFPYLLDHPTTQLRVDRARQADQRYQGPDVQL